MTDEHTIREISVKRRERLALLHHPFFAASFERDFKGSYWFWQHPVCEPSRQESKPTPKYQEQLISGI